MNTIHKSAWIHIVDRQVLSTRSKGKDAYYFPGGKPEGNETAEETLTREIKEELSVDLVFETIEELGTFEAEAHGKAEGAKVIMRCFTGQYVGILKPDAEIEEMVWLTYADKDKTSAVDQIIFDWLKERDVIN